MLAYQRVYIYITAWNLLPSFSYVISPLKICHAPPVQCVARADRKATAGKRVTPNSFLCGETVAETLQGLRGNIMFVCC